MARALKRAFDSLVSWVLERPGKRMSAGCAACGHPQARCRCKRGFAAGAEVLQAFDQQYDTGERRCTRTRALRRALRVCAQC